MRESKQIYLEACGEIATALERDGFRWRKSNLDIVKKDDDLTFRIWFQSSFRNALLTQEPAKNEYRSSFTGELFIPLEARLADIARFGSITLMVHVSIHAESMKKWRSTLGHPIRTDDGVAGTNIGHLAANPGWLDVNLADPAVRPSRVEAMIDLIRTTGFDYFERFRHPEWIVEALRRSSDPGMLDYMELEYAVCYGSTEIGRAVLRRHLQQWPDCAKEYREALNEYRQHDIPRSLHGRLGPRLARMALALDIEQ